MTVDGLDPAPLRPPADMPERPRPLGRRVATVLRSHGPRPVQPGLLASGQHGLPILAGLGCIAAWCGVFLFFAFGRERLFDAVGSFGLMGHPVTATMLRVLTVGGLGTAAVLAALARQSNGRRAPGLLVVLTLVAVTLDMDAIGAAEGMSPAVGTVPTDLSNRWWPDLTRLGAVAVPALGVLVAFAVPLLPRHVGPRAIACLVATPYVAYLLGHALTGRLWAPWIANADYRGDALYRVLPELQVMLLLYLLFSLVTWVDLVLRTGTRLGEVSSRFGWWVLPTLVGAKLFWLLLGLVGLLPVALGGGTVVWERARDDGLAGWGTAAVVGVLVVGLYLHAGTRRRAIPARTVLGIDRDLGRLLVLLAAPPLLAGVVSLVFSLDWYAFPDTPPKLLRLLAFVAGALVIARTVPGAHGSMVARALGWARTAAIAGAAALLIGLTFSNPLPSDEHIVFSVFSSNGPTLVVGHYFLAVLVCAVVAGAVFVRRGSAAGSACVVAIFLLPVAIAHALPLLPSLPFAIDPQLAGATGDLVRPITATEVVPAPAQPWSTWWRSAAGTFTRPTFDVVVSVLVFLVVVRYRGRPDDLRRLSPLLFMLLLVSTVIGQADVVRPTGWFGDRWFYLAFLVPVIYQFVVRADDMNKSLQQQRPAGALATVSGVLLLLTIAGYSASIGFLEPGRSLESQAFAYGRGITTDFFILVIACAVLVSWAARTSRTPSQAHVGGGP